MNSSQDLTNNIESMIRDLNLKDRFKSREDIYIECVSTRLDESLQSYLHDLTIAEQSILSLKNDLRTLKKLNKV